MFFCIKHTYVLGICLLVYFLQTCRNDLDVRKVFHTFNNQFIMGCPHYHAPHASQREQSQTALP